MSVFLLFPISFTLQNHLLFNSNLSQIHYIKEFLFTNQSLASSLTYQIETTEFYPYLPIQIYTKNREKFFKLKNKTNKIILLANTWFTDPTWSIKSIKNKTNSGNSMSKYSSK
jgi:hypothetical protein